MNKAQEATQEIINLFKHVRIARIVNDGYPAVKDPTGHYEEDVNINGKLYHIKCDITEKDVKPYLDKRSPDPSCFA